MYYHWTCILSHCIMNNQHWTMDMYYNCTFIAWKYIAKYSGIASAMTSCIDEALLLALLHETAYSTIRFYIYSTQAALRPLAFFCSGCYCRAGRWCWWRIAKEGQAAVGRYYAIHNIGAKLCRGHGAPEGIIVPCAGTLQIRTLEHCISDLHSRLKPQYAGQYRPKVKAFTLESATKKKTRKCSTLCNAEQSGVFLHIVMPGIIAASHIYVCIFASYFCKLQYQKYQGIFVHHCLVEHNCIRF